MKKYDVYLTPDAINDLKSIYEYIIDKSGFHDFALNYIQKLRQKCNDLKIAPMRGKRRDDLRKNLRIVPLDKKTICAFELDEEEETVTILNIFHGGRDYETIMRDPLNKF